MANATKKKKQIWRTAARRPRIEHAKKTSESQSYKKVPM